MEVEVAVRSNAVDLSWSGSTHVGTASHDHIFNSGNIDVNSAKLLCITSGSSH